MLFLYCWLEVEAVAQLVFGFIILIITNNTVVMNCKLIFKNLFLVSLLLIGVTACSDNDNPKGGEVSQDLTTTIERINQSVESMQHLVTMLSEYRNITEVNLEAGSADLKFGDLATVSVYSGQTNSAIPTLSFAKKDNKYYWTVVYQGKTTELTTISRDPLEVKPLKTSTGFPVIGTLYKEGIGRIWTVDTGSGSYALLDESGKEILASADPKFTAFDNIELSNADYIGLSLVGIEDVLKISRVDISFRISLPEDNLPVLFKYEASQEVSYSVNNLTEVAIKAIPKGWTATLNTEDNKIQITAPTGELDSDDTSGAVILRAEDKNKQEYTVEYPLYSLDLTHRDGTFIVIEGNMTSENGTLYYIDQYNRHHEELYEDANGEELGNVVQDMFIANNKLYLINQNGPQQGGGDRFVICNPRTLKREYSHNLGFVGADGAVAWTQHIVVVGDKVFIQHASSRMEAESGIRVFNFKTGQVAAKDIEGTQGEFTKEGALKGRMFLSRGKIYAGLGSAVVIINPDTEKVEKTIPFKSQVKGIVKASDNNLYVTVAGSFEGHPNMMPEFKTNPLIVCLDHSGTELWRQELNDIELPIATWSPSVGLCASFTDDYIYFVSTADFNANYASRFNIKTKELQKDYAYVDENLYGYMGVHPTTNIIYVGQSSAGFTQATVNLFELGKDKAKLISSFQPEKASPAGVDFGYRFTDEFINK